MPQVTDAVHALPLETERRGQVSQYTPTAIETDSGLVLLDVGFPHTLDQLEAGLAESRFGLDDVELIVLTHHDGDHAAGLVALLPRTDALVATHAEEVAYVDGRSFPIKTPEGQERYEPAPIDLELVGGEVIRTAAGPLELLHTPGHSPGHLSAYLPEAKLLIAADAMTAEDGLAGPKEMYTPDLATATDSVGRLADLDVERVICYHGGPLDATTDEVRAVYDSLQG